MRLVRLIIVFGWLLASSVVQAQTWPREERVPGGIAIIKIPQQSEAPPQVVFNKKRVYTAKKDGQWFAWVGIPLNQKLGKTQAYWRTRDGDLPLPFTVKNKDYAIQELKVAPKHVNLSAEDLARVRRETPELRGAMNNFRPVVLPLPSIVLPTEGRQSGSFGLRRVFNGESRNPHTGLDIAAPQGTPIKAALPGRVVAQNHYFFNGKTLVLDHGQGLTSLYCHMSRFADLKVGDEVKAGQLIGEVGTTGRSTGPHLHWTMSLNTARVNPSLFLQKAAN
ncbi:M23 family metallopeptidase [Marinospirillum insulare]|uniref:Peptidase n=1 Tax=Marinospirillum insulare TaxID=217169 RepID=A0ABQ6A1M4_9GAMM|nr:M23 family metallopeptidase [Marinospirillum insulare]GLR64816.1 peptidase [Marinospirillum insulare]